MKVELMMFLDKWVGIPLCIILSIGRVFDLLRRHKQKEINKILVIRLWGTGDLVIALFALRALRKSFSKAHITLLVAANITDIVEGDPSIDKLIVLNTSKIFKAVRSFSSALREIWKERFDLVIDLEQFSRTSALFAYLSGARVRIGFDTSKQWRGFLFTHRVPFDDEQHTLECFSDLISAASISLPVKKLEKLWITAEDRRFASEFLKAHKVTDDDVKIGIHIGSGERGLFKRWPKERFAELADRLMKDNGGKVVFVGGPNEIEDVEETIRLMNSEPINSTGKITLKQLAALLENCSLFIGNDTAPMHIAAAMGTPTIGLFGPSTPLRFGPYGKEHVAIYKDVGCNPCITMHSGKKAKCTKQYYCMRAISVGDVMETVDSITSSKIQGRPLLKEK